MRAKLVTGYVPIAGHPRGPTEYGALGEKLGGVPVRKKAFYDQVQNLWMTKFLRELPFVPKATEYDNPEKNTLPYHIVNHEKTAWLAQAAAEDLDCDVVVWVDYGIFRLPGICNEAIHRFMASVDDQAIYAPGCWNAPDVIESSFPCWRFCGSVLSVPARLASEFDAACRAEARQHIRATKNVEFEVNTWARVEKRRKYKFPIRWYEADHDVSMFTNFRNLKDN